MNAHGQVPRLRHYSVSSRLRRSLLFGTQSKVNNRNQRRIRNGPAIARSYHCWSPIRCMHPHLSTSSNLHLLHVYNFLDFKIALDTFKVVILTTFRSPFARQVQGSRLVLLATAYWGQNLQPNCHCRPCLWLGCI
jgi:hypothetical protein